MINIIASPFLMEDIQKLKQAGATSIVAGSVFYSVRGTTNWTMEELKEAKRQCVAEGLQLYVLVNHFFMEAELSKLREYLVELKELDVDGIYFSDLAVYQEAKKIDMEDQLIYNPDTILTNANDIQDYLDLGIKMCTISKEITLEDMIQIANKIKGSLEVIVHGRLHMLHSKRELLSNYMQFLDKDLNLKNNKNLIIKEEKREEEMPIMEDDKGTHIFTGFTLSSFEEVADIVSAGIENLRIESMFYEIDEVCQMIKDYSYVLSHPEEGRDYFQTYQQEYPKQNITKGFLYKKTGAAK